MSGRKDIMLGSFFFFFSPRHLFLRFLEVLSSYYHSVILGYSYITPPSPLPPPLPASLDSAQLEHNLEVVCIP